jgi:hypothetical protein
VRTEVIPVITGATGTVSKSFRKYLSNVPGKHEYQGTTENSYIGHSTHTAGSDSVEAQKGLMWEITLHVA